MSKVDEIQILDDIELEDVVGGVVKKKVAKRKVAAKKKAAVRRVTAVTPSGVEVSVPANAVNGNGLSYPDST